MAKGKFESINIRSAENGYSVTVDYPPKKGSNGLSSYEPTKPYVCRSKKELDDYLDNIIGYHERSGKD